MGVTVGGVSCQSLTITDQTTATCDTPTASAGVAPVQVTTAGGTSGAQPFTYDDQPTITNPAPQLVGTNGTSVLKLTGTAFVPGYTTVRIDGQACNLLTSSVTGTPTITDTALSCTVPAGPAGPATLILTTPGGSATLALVYEDAPTVSAISPSRGPLAGGTPITLTGTNFDTGLSVIFTGTTPARPCGSLRRISATEATCVTPAGTSPGRKLVLVWNVGGGTTTFFAFDDVPAISGIAPNQGPLAGGNTITISGSSFVAGQTSVTVGGTVCSNVTVAAGGASLACTVPAGSAGSAPVVVTTTGGTSVSPLNYTYDDVPTVSAVSPARGPLAGGTIIQVAGTGFVTGATAVTVGGRVCAQVKARPAGSTLTCVVPAGVAGAAQVVVTTPGGTVTAGAAFTYDPAPTLDSVVPGAGPTNGGNLLQLLGTGFVNNATQIRISGTNCTLVQHIQDTENRCVAPPGTAGNKTVVVSTPGGIALGSYTYDDAPTVTSLKPPAGPVNGGTVLKLEGSNFVAPINVTVGGRPCSSLVVTSEKAASCVTPTGTAGIADVVVTTPGGTATGSFTYDDVPSISTVTPDQGPVAGGTTITLSGSGFVPGTGVSVGGSTCGSLIIVDQSTASCVTPPGSTGAAEVLVSNPGGTASGNFTYDDVPTLSSVTPTTGPLTGGTTITLAGSGFIPGTTVTVAGAACTNLAISSQGLATCLTPPGTAGVATVSVSNPGGTATGVFNYDSVPTISGIAPEQGPVSGGTSVVISGSGFVAGTSVTVGGQACASLTLVSQTSAVCTTPPGTAGPATISVSNPGGSVNALFTYDDAPTLTSISPSVGTVNGGTTITLTGSGFIAGTTVSVGSNPCSSVVLNSPASLSCVTPAGTAGVVQVAVSNPGGTAAGFFTYDEAPTLDAVSPGAGPVLGGTTVTLSGSGFAQDTIVTIGGTACGSLNLASETSATCVTPAAPGNTAGVAQVMVSNAGGMATGTFTYDDRPTLTSVNPSEGPVAGGTRITLNGSGYINGTTVTLGDGNDACTNIAIASESSLSCDTPPGVAGVAAVLVSNPGGTASGTFTYDDLPKIKSIKPKTGPTTGDLPIEITGSSFIADTTVTVGSEACTNLVRTSDTTLTCTLPPGAAGVALVEVSNLGGTATDFFQYVEPQLTLQTLQPGVTATLSVVGCGRIETAQFIPAPAGAPAGVDFPFGLLDFSADACASAPAPIEVTVRYSEPFPAGDATFYKEDAGSYSVYPATIGLDSVTYQIVDGGSGDDDGMADNRITDPGGVGITAVNSGRPAIPVPTLSFWAMLLLMAAILSLTALRYRASY
jgi:hypothetical protein